MSVDEVSNTASMTKAYRDHLGREFDQAWQHYRHLENLRNQYLNYALTLTLAVMASSIPLSSIVRDNPRLLLLSASFVLVYTLFVALTCAGVFNIRSLNNHHTLVLLTIRDHLLSGGPEAIDVSFLNRRHYADRFPLGRFLRNQAWAEVMLMIMLALASSASVALAFATLALHVGDMYVVSTWSIAGVVIAIFLCAGIVLSKVRRVEQRVLAGPAWAKFR
jgi:hypothetical protein